MADKASVIGIDLGGTKTLMDLVNRRGKVIASIKIKTHAEKDWDDLADRLEPAIKELTKKAGKNGGPVAVGLGFAGKIEPRKGTIVECLNIPFLVGAPLVRRLQEWTGARCVTANDVRMGLYGELRFGAAKGCRNVIGFFVGTGIGGAVVIDGKIYTGSHGTAGDIGQYLTDPFGPLTGSGRHGRLDDTVSRTAIAADAAALAAKQWAPTIYKEAGTEVQKISSGVIARAVEQGDEHVVSLVRSRARLLGVAASNLVSFLDPDMVVLGGGLVEALPKMFVEETRAALKEQIGGLRAARVKVAASKLQLHAVTIGAAQFAWDAIDAQ